MSTGRRILVVEDERDIAEMIAYNLERAGHAVAIVHDGEEGLRLALASPPDLVVLDLMLPGASGLDIAKTLREHAATKGVPILMLTARAEEHDQVTGLSAGADDYVTKPFSMKVLVARVEALLRRASQPGQTVEASPTLRVGTIIADLDGHSVSVNGEQAKLTLTEYKLLIALMQSPRRVLSRADLISRVMGPGIVVTARTIDVHIASIRKKLGAAGDGIRTIRGVGYQLHDQPVHRQNGARDVAGTAH